MTDGSVIAYPFAAGRILTRVLEAGGGDDAIVFLHGLGARADRWRATLPSFAAQGYRTFAIDLPGHGFAAKDAGIPLDVPGFAGFLRDFLDAMGIPRPILVGTSLGGHVAGHFAAENPTRPRALVLVGAVGLVPLGREAGDKIRRNVRETSRDAIEKKLEFVLADPSLIGPSLIEEEHRINTSPGAAEVFRRLGDYIAEEIDCDNVADRLKPLAGTLPMLLVWGELDRAVPLTVGQQARQLLGLDDLVVIPRAGHAPYMEQPALFERQVLRFLARLRP
jgi:pimeloyl-ACP methyl ester carboxylesterase